ncbi:hypothetical protein SAMN05444354_10757 [Stigmatella aurantiaca]|uniref:Uncharacterized protein n=1 Tax=Stigmatella aurantiaca TaxID=41 RepID=A0A1H7RHZ0_STIAU|nr:hypothetical protein [Stigmatella aurantiaca]SEL59861.1 hypothetical protein SAMN05444354_10757 [Stigmatella aurantiaca]
MDIQKNAEARASAEHLLRPGFAALLRQDVEDFVERCIYSEEVRS